MDTVASLTLPERVVLAAVATLERDGETPVQVNVVTQHCQTYTESLPDIGRLSEADVDGALNTLEAKELVEVPEMGETSPIGKGRPAFEPATDADDILASLAADDQLEDVVESPETA